MTATDLTPLAAEQVTQIAEWLRAIGYGFDFSAPDHPIPEFMRRPLAEAWHRHEAVDETVEQYEQTLQAEGAW